MQNIIPPIETSSTNQLEELEPVLKEYHDLLALKYSAFTAKHKLQALRRFIAHLMLAKKHFRTITRQDVEVFIALQQASPHTTQNVLLTIRRFFDYLVERGVVAQNPAAEVLMRVRKARPLTIVPSVAQIKAVFRKLEQDKSPQGRRNLLMVELAYGSGLRVGEIATMNVEDVSLTDQTAHVLGKGRKERVVPLTNRCFALWESFVQKTGNPKQAVFVCSNGQRLTSGAVSQTIKQKTGYNAHLFRHACATHMLIAGCSVRYIQELLGHERLETTVVYTNLNKEDLRAILNEKHPGRLRSFMPTNPDEEP